MNYFNDKLPALSAGLALRKLATEGENGAAEKPGIIDHVSNWFAENPRWGRAALYGGGAFLGTGLISALLGSKNSLGWAIPAALIAGAYGHQKEEADKLAADTYNKVGEWVNAGLTRGKKAINAAKDVSRQNGALSK